MSRSRLAVDAHAGMIVTLVHLGAEMGAARNARVSEMVGDVFRGDLR